MPISIKNGMHWRCDFRNKNN